MDEKQIQSALEKIVTNESLTDELADDEAELLLQWGESQVYRLADQITETEAFDEATHKLRKLLSGINWFIGLRGDMAAEEQHDVLLKIVEAAQAVGYTHFTPEQIGEFLQYPVSADNCENMNLLTKWINAHDPAANVLSADALTADTSTPDALMPDETPTQAESAPNSEPAADDSDPAANDFSSDISTI